ncbi:MAG: CbiX/SirB N-terminal domain-containing protein [Bryobacterales bacterium]|nr:CbiX/SirB N-terminal domain-containing protein [Bryobacterales bacterium]
MKTAIIVFAHGSSVESANEAVRSVTAAVAESGGWGMAETAFLELASPDLPEAVAHVAGQGAVRVIVVPYFLTLGIHLRRDLPRIIADILLDHPGLRIEVTEPLDGHPGLREIVLERAKKALEC